MSFDFKTYLIQRQQQVEEALNHYLPAPTGAFAKIHEAMRYSVFAGGKRLRPLLCLASFEIFKDRLQEVLPTACAIELVHTYSLIHDDLPCMDNDDFRRGKPTNHKVFGEAMAVLAGDALLTLAFELITRAPILKPAMVVTAIRELAQVSGTTGLIGGQVQDLEAEGKTILPEQLQAIHLYKTAALLSGAVRLGGILGEANAKELKSLSHFGEKLGLSFQIIDDVLDVESTTEIMGKQTQKDFMKEKATYPALYGVERSRQMAKELYEEALVELKRFGRRVQALQALASLMINRQH